MSYRSSEASNLVTVGSVHYTARCKLCLLNDRSCSGAEVGKFDLSWPVHTVSM
jgi:hypothetical protein